MRWLACFEQPRSSAVRNAEALGPFRAKLDDVAPGHWTNPAKDEARLAQRACERLKHRRVSRVWQAIARGHGDQDA